MRIFKHISFYILILFCISGIDICAQVVVERSENRVIISGVEYYIHIAKKGETAYSISRAYGITIEELGKENNLSEHYAVNEGQSLRIPVKSVEHAGETQAEIRQKDEANYIYHTISQGETIYSLSRLYGVSEDDIKQSNSDIDVTKISIGAEIAIPRRQLTTNSQNVEIETSTYIYHRAQRGESLASIARQYNITVRELRRENSGIIFLQTGSLLRIPGQQVEEKIETIADNVEDEIIVPVDFEEPVRIERPSEPTNFTKLSGKINVAVLLPFYFRENSSAPGTDYSRNRGRQEDWIFPESLDFIEMYEGILFAVDTLRSLGLDINIHAYDIQRDTVALSRLIRSGDLRNMDLIIGPAYSNNLKIATEYARNFDIPVISPVPLIDNSLLKGNPNLFIANPTLEVAQNALAKRIAEHRNHNFIFIHADSLGVDEDVKRFRNALIRENVRFREMRFFSRSMLGNDPNRLANALSNQTGNVVIIASESAPVISETITDIHGLSRRFDVKVFGYPLLRELENLEPSYFFDLDILLYSTFWIDYDNPNVKQFNADFRTKFFTQPSEISFAWQGYDIAYYFISGLVLYGKDFIKNPFIHRPELLHTDFDFVRKSSEDGFENQKLFPIRYTRNFDIILENNENP